MTWARDKLLARWPAALLVVAVAAYPLLAPNDYYMRLGSLAALSIIVLASLNLIYGYAGQVSVGHIAFYGIGAYASGLLIAREGLSFWLAWPAATAISAAIGLLVALPVLRLRGFYLLVATFGFGLAAFTVFQQWQSLTGGAIGVIGVIRPELFGFTFASEESYYWLSAVAMLVALALVWLIVRSPFGRILMALREGETPVQVLGIDTVRAKTAAFVISTAIAGAAGGLFGPLILFVSPQSFTVEQSILLLAVLVIGGLGRHWGAILGGVVLVALTEGVRSAGSYKEVVYGTILLGAVLFMPEGIVGAADRVVERVRRALKREGGEDAALAPPPLRPAAVPTFLRADSRERSQTVLEVENVGCRLGEFVALDGVDLRVDSGELVGLIGPNGAGKSTLINAITGLVPAWCGEIRIDGEPAQALSCHRRAALGVGRTFQTTRLFGRLSVIDNVLVGLHAAGVRDRRESTRRADELLELVQLAELAGEPAARLPFGRRRLLELARALAAGPRVLLLDEPAAGLNDAETDRLAAILRWLTTDARMGVLLVEHDLRLVLGTCDRVVVLVSGAKLADGPPAAVQADECVIEAYIGRRRAREEPPRTDEQAAPAVAADAVRQEKGNVV
jgi:branched-chain amino acid transport system ATP-binding protein